MTQNTQNKPVRTFRLRGISASIFENTTYTDGQPVIFYKVSLQRSFRQGGEYKHNSSFSRDDLPVAGLVLRRAWEFILDQEAASSAETNHE